MLTLYVFVGSIYALILFTWAILFVGISFITADTTQTSSAELASAKTKLSGYLSDSISNISSTILFSGSTKESKTIQKAVTEVAKSEKKYNAKRLKCFLPGLFSNRINVSICVCPNLWRSKTFYSCR